MSDKDGMATALDLALLLVSLVFFFVAMAAWLLDDVEGATICMLMSIYLRLCYAKE